VWTILGFQQRSTRHLPIITRFDQLDRPSYYRFQTLELFAVVNLTRGQLLGHRVCPGTLLLLLLRSFFKRSLMYRRPTVIQQGGAIQEESWK
jgi:hypothetical protein